MSKDKYLDLLYHYNNGNKIVWNDPDYIEGNDYTISYLEELEDEVLEVFDTYTPIKIQYNKGFSEAEVFLHEIIKVEHI